MGPVGVEVADNSADKSDVTNRANRFSKRARLATFGLFMFVAALIAISRSWPGGLLWQSDEKFYEVGSRVSLFRDVLHVTHYWHPTPEQLTAGPGTPATGSWKLGPLEVRRLGDSSSGWGWQTYGWHAELDLFWPLVALGPCAIASQLWVLRALVGRCARCKYDLAGLPAGSPCPECGGFVGPPGRGVKELVPGA